MCQNIENQIVYSFHKSGIMFIGEDFHKKRDSQILLLLVFFFNIAKIILIILNEKKST